MEGVPSTKSKRLARRLLIQLIHYTAIVYTIKPKNIALKPNLAVPYQTKIVKNFNNSKVTSRNAIGIGPDPNSYLFHGSGS